MTATTIRQVEGLPSAWPDPPANLSPAATELDAAWIWQRIEMFISYRWAERAVTWVVEGPGEWSPPLCPVIGAMAVQRWNGAAWVDVVLPPASLGGFDLHDGARYQIKASVGEGPAPADGLEAFKRLAEYHAVPDASPGVTSQTLDVADVGRQSFDRSAQWLARSMQYSGAADLLRPYRRAE